MWRLGRWFLESLFLFASFFLTIRVLRPSFVHTHSTHSTHSTYSTSASPSEHSYIGGIQSFRFPETQGHISQDEARLATLWSQTTAVTNRGGDLDLGSMHLFSQKPATHYVVVQELESYYDALVATGQIRPFVYPFGAIGAIVAIAYLCVDHRKRTLLARCRFLVWGFLAASSLWSLLYTRGRNPAAAFGVGLICAWATLWSSVLLVFNDAQRDFRRVERVPVSGVECVSADGPEEAAANGHTDDLQNHANGNGHLRKRNLPPKARDGSGAVTQPNTKLIWQSYPSGPLQHRLNWVCDLFSTFRGMGWNWRIAGLPTPPEPIVSETPGSPKSQTSHEDIAVSHTGVHRYDSKKNLVRHNLYLLARNYFILDLLKTLIVIDPYFWNGSYSRPPGYLPQSLQDSLVAVKCSRLLISFAAIYFALQTIFALGPVFFAGILGEKMLNVRGEAWIYCDQFGPFSNVLDKGLAGWWGGYWHQTFRFGFESPSSRIIEMLGWEKKSPKAKFLQLCFAFTLSGCLHACGSYTQLGNTRPLRGPLSFFVLQIFGISFQIAATAALDRMGLRKKAPSWLGRVVNFVYVHVWMYYTAPLLVDDFAAGGVWLFEPLPVSLFRGLGFGAKEDGWFPILGNDNGSDVVRWHSGSSWWDTGIAL